MMLRGSEALAVTEVPISEALTSLARRSAQREDG